MISSVQRRLLVESKGQHKPYRLPYAYDALEPYISVETMETHYKQHYLKYLEKFNKLVSGNKRLSSMPVEKLLESIDSVPKSIREDINFNGGGYHNHTIFWHNLKPGGPERPQYKLMQTMHEKFGGLRKFKYEFGEEALSIKGSGWCWLVERDGKISIITTENQTSPHTKKYTPLLGLDMWEHAHYLQYKADKKKYIEAFWNVVNWDDVSKRLSTS